MQTKAIAVRAQQFHQRPRYHDFRVALGLLLNTVVVAIPLVFLEMAAAHRLPVMLLFAAYTTWQRAREVPAVFALSLLAYAASAAVTLGVLFGFRVYELEGRTIVPLAGIVVGNSLAATVLVSRRLFDAGRERRTEIEGRHALGLSASEAFQPVLRESLRTALIPQIETTKAVGIIALPGAMVGLILAGVDPADAVRVQISVMYLVLGSVATTTAVMSIGISHKMFTSSDQLIRRS